MFLDGIGRWGFDSMLETAATLVGDGSLGSALPTWLSNSTTFEAGASNIFWDDIPSSLDGQWDGFALIVDDVLKYTGTATNWSISALDASIPHYFRWVLRVSRRGARSSTTLTSALLRSSFRTGSPISLMARPATLLVPPKPSSQMARG